MYILNTIEAEKKLCFIIFYLHPSSTYPPPLKYEGGFRDFFNTYTS